MFGSHSCVFTCMSLTFEILRLAASTFTHKYLNIMHIPIEIKVTIINILRLAVIIVLFFSCLCQWQLEHFSWKVLSFTYICMSVMFNCVHMCLCDGDMHRSYCYTVSYFLIC